MERRNVERAAGTPGPGVPGQAPRRVRAGRTPVSSATVRNLVVVLGDQLDPDAACFDGFDPQHDAVLMSEVDEEAARIAQHAQRLVLFFSAMRHLRDTLAARGRTVHYGTLDDAENTGTLAGELERRARAPKS